MIDFNDASPKIVPFGKYKGQPVEVLAQDKGYVDWMLSQDWFRERYASFHTLIVNNFSTDTETPEHNSLQVLFLDDAFCFSFAKACRPNWISEWFHEPLVAAGKSLKRALAEAEKEIAEYSERIRKNDRINQWERDRYNKAVENERSLFRSIEAIPRTLTYAGVITEKQFEVRGVDVVFSCTITSHEKIPNSYGPPAAHRDKMSFSIEIKPSVGDDYPAILRQMKVNRSSYLFTRKYTGVGATKEQFVKTMKLSDIVVVFKDDIDEQHT